jgi:hypothetical protein
MRPDLMAFRTAPSVTPKARAKARWDVHFFSSILVTFFAYCVP